MHEQALTEEGSRTGPTSGTGPMAGLRSVRVRWMGTKLIEDPVPVCEGIKRVMAEGLPVWVKGPDTVGQYVSLRLEGATPEQLRAIAADWQALRGTWLQESARAVDFQI